MFSCFSQANAFVPLASHIMSASLRQTRTLVTRSSWSQWTLLYLQISVAFPRDTGNQTKGHSRNKRAKGSWPCAGQFPLKGPYSLENVCWIFKFVLVVLSSAFLPFPSHWYVQEFCRMVTIATAEQEKWDFFFTPLKCIYRLFTKTGRFASSHRGRQRHLIQLPVGFNCHSVLTLLTQCTRICLLLIMFERKFYLEA